MKLQLISSDNLLLRYLKDTNLFTEHYDVDDVTNLFADCVILSDLFVPYNDLMKITVKNNQQVFYMLQNHYEPNLERNIKVICDSKNIHLIPPRLTEPQIAEYIESVFKEGANKKTNVVTFFSPISNIGTTTTVLSVAKALQKTTEAKIGVLLLNAWDHGTHLIEYKGKFLDEIKGQLHNELINNRNEFLSLFHMIGDEELYILGGNRLSKLERLFTKEEIYYLIQLSKQYFDVVLIDSGSHFDNANMVQSLREADMKFLIVNQQTKSLSHFNRIYDEILYPIGYKKEEFLGIVNRYDDQPYYLTIKNIENEINVPIITPIYELKDSLLLESEKRIPYDTTDRLYDESIKRIAIPIIKANQLKERTVDIGKKKRWFFN